MIAAMAQPRWRFGPQYGEGAATGGAANRSQGLRPGGYTTSAGHSFQGLLAYLLAAADYRRVRIKASIGVPEIEVSDFVGGQESDGSISVILTRAQLSRLLVLCEEAGDVKLARTLWAVIGKS